MGEKDITARYLLVDLVESISEDDLRNYFCVFGDIEEVTLRTLPSGTVTGSVKFHNPTAELRRVMLNELHVINDVVVTVQTWKMQKKAKPGWAMKQAALTSG